MTTSTQHLVLQQPLDNTKIDTAIELIRRHAECTLKRAKELVDKVIAGEAVGVISDNPRFIKVVELAFKKAGLIVYINLDDIYAEPINTQISRRLKRIENSVGMLDWHDNRTLLIVESLESTYAGFQNA